MADDLNFGVRADIGPVLGVIGFGQRDNAGAAIVYPDDAVRPAEALDHMMKLETGESFRGDGLGGGVHNVCMLCA
jgi:hypothetical protein